MAPATALGGSGEVAVLFNFDRVAVSPMRTQFGRRLWIRRGCQSSPEPSKVRRSSNLRAATRSVFRSRVVVVVDFERGDTVEQADKLEADAKVRLSLADYVIRRLGTGEYRYAVTVIRASGQSKDSEWRTDRIEFCSRQSSSYRTAVNGASNVSRKSD